MSKRDLQTILDLAIREHFEWTLFFIKCSREVPHLLRCMSFAHYESSRVCSYHHDRYLDMLSVVSHCHVLL